MVSAQIKGIMRFYRRKPDGNKTLLYEADIQQLGPGGSSEGAIANTPEKWINIPSQDRVDKVMRPNDQLHVTFEAAAGATSDASDGAVVLPLTLNGGSTINLGPFTNVNSWDILQFGDVALLANQETTIAIKTIRDTLVLGSNTQNTFISVENNA